MGSAQTTPEINYSLPGSMSQKLSVKIQSFNKMRSTFARTIEPMKAYQELIPLRLEITSRLKISLETAQIPLIELYSYLLGNLGQNMYQDKESLKQKRTELFEFVQNNIFSHPQFVVTKILKTLNERAQKLLPDLKYSNLSMIKLTLCQPGYMERRYLQYSLIERQMRIPNNILHNCTEASQQKIPNYLLEVRDLEVQFISKKIKKSLLQNHSDHSLKKTKSLKEELLNEEKLGYDAIVNLIERIAKSRSFTSKYKLLSIMFDTIPQLYLQEQIKNKKSYHKSNSSGIQKQGKTSLSETFLLKKTFEVETMLSTMLSTDKKREISRIMLNEWLLLTKRDIIVDVLVPFKLLQEDGYIHQPQHFLHAFLHGLYELIEVDQNRNSLFL